MKKLNNRFNRTRTFQLIIFGILIGLHLMAQPPSHDPSRIMKDGDRYWSFYTHDGIAELSAGSPDFSDWQGEGTVFGDTWPSWINTYVPDFAGQFWAPSCIYINNKYYLYYSCSTMGAFNSAIGLATSPSLNNPVWEDQGMVVYSSGSGSATVSNAIDPAIFLDDDGSLWMVYGSWFGGITLTELDSLTGKPVGSKTKLVGGNHQDYEGAYLLKHEGYYYLFVNRGLCCRGVNSTYYIQVGRSSEVTGPFYDWRTFLTTDDRYIGPGHIGYNEGRLTYHIYDKEDNGAAKMMNTTMSWENGWPVADSVSQEPPGMSIPNGTYRIQAYDTTKIVGVSNNNPIVGANVQLWNYSDDNINGQSWTITNQSLHQYKISPNNFSDLAMDVYNCVGDNGANIGLWSYWGGQCQKWIFTDMGNHTYQIRSALSNKPIHIDGSIVNGTNIIQMSNQGIDPNQLFTLELLEPEDTSGNGFPVILSYSSYQDGNPPSNVLDGNNADGSRWSAENFPQYIVIDYGESKSIKGIQVWTYQDRAYQYKVELDDNVNFSNPYIIDRTTNSDANQPITDNFDPVLARYAKLTVTGAYNYTGTWVSITEFKIDESNTGIEQENYNNKRFLSLYPSPANKILNIKFGEEYSANTKLAIYNSSGQLVIKKNEMNKNMETIDISALHEGIYILILTDGQFIAKERFIKTK